MGRTVHYRSDTYWGLKGEGVSCLDWRHWARMFWAGKFTNGVVHVMYGRVATSRVCIRNTITFPIEGAGKVIKWIAELLKSILFALIPVNCLQNLENSQTHILAYGGNSWYWKICRRFFFCIVAKNRMLSTSCVSARPCVFLWDVSADTWKEIWRWRL